MQVRLSVAPGCDEELSSSDNEDVVVDAVVELLPVSSKLDDLSSTSSDDEGDEEGDTGVPL